MYIKKIPGIFILGCVLSVTVGAQTSGEGTLYYDANGQIVNGVPAPIEVITVGQRQTGVSTILSASVVPYREVTFSAEVAGRVEYIAGREGDRFNPQEVLVAIGSEKLLARRGQVVANLNNANLALQNSQMQYGREMWSPKSRDINRSPGMGMPSMFDQFFTRNMGSGMGYGNPFLERYSDLYSSGTQMGQAQGQHLAVLSKLREIDASLRDTRTVSPFSGVIVEKMVEAGDTVQPGQPLLKYADLANLQLSVEVPSRLIHVMEQGMVVPAMLDFNHQYIDVRLAQIYPVGNAQRHTITVKFDLPVGISAWPGTYAEIMLPDGAETSETLIEIPTSAVIRRGSLPVVYVIKSNRRELRLVRLGASYAAGRVTVLAGLKAGEQLLVNPPAGVTSGWHEQPAGIKTY
jgi:multidrug efflux pump subunit AcrA (membrane-fusion protein)